MDLGVSVLALVVESLDEEAERKRLRQWVLRGKGLFYVPLAERRGLARQVLPVGRDLPAMRKIALGTSAVPDSARRAVLDVFDSGQFSPGPMVREFEKQFAALHKAKHAVFVNSGTDALRLGLMALKEKYGWNSEDSVVVPSLTFVATVNVILQAGLNPFFVDVNRYTCLINPYNMQRRLECQKAKVVAMMPVHLFGQACSRETFEMARTFKLKVLEDSCETILNPIRGEISCHSTYMAHHVTTGVGGFALTNDTELMLIIRSLANHGRNDCYLPGYTDVGGVTIQRLRQRFSFDRVGYSCRGTEFEAALGLSQLSGLHDNILRRQLVASLLSKALSVFPQLLLIDPQDSTWMMFPIVLHEDSKIDKYKLCLHLEKNGIETRDMMPITSQPCYKGLVREDDFPVAANVNKNGFYMACHPAMTKGDVKHIRKTFEEYLTKR